MLAASTATIEREAQQLADAAARREQARKEERERFEQRRKELRDMTVEQLAQDKQLPQEISRIKDPEQRAQAQRLLSDMKAEAAARQPSKSQWRGEGAGARRLTAAAPGGEPQMPLRFIPRGYHSVRQGEPREPALLHQAPAVVGQLHCGRGRGRGRRRGVLGGALPGTPDRAHGPGRTIPATAVC